MFNVKFVPGNSSVWNQAWSWFLADMLQTGQWLNEWGFTTEIDYCDKWLLVNCLKYPKQLKQKEARQIWHSMLSSAIADFFVDKLEDRLIIHTLRYTYGYRSLIDLKQLYLYCDKCLNDTSFDEELTQEWAEDALVDERKQLIYNEMYPCLNEEECIHLDGFYRFRLKAYQEKLDEAIHFALDEYVLDQEYEKFLQLMRLYVNSNPPKSKLIHVVHIDEDQFYLFDHSGKEISLTEQIGQMTNSTDYTGSREALLISALFSYLPRRIIMHTSQEDQAIIRHLKQIFDFRFTICTDCVHCQSWKEVDRLTFEG